MREQLITRQITVKISDGMIVIGAVVAVDDAGLWIQLASDAAPVPAKNSIDIKEWFVHRGTSGVEKVTEEARAPGLITVPAWEKS
jgi:hypothetical protein